MILAWYWRSSTVLLKLYWLPKSIFRTGSEWVCGDVSLLRVGSRPSLPLDAVSKVYGAAGQFWLCKHISVCDPTSVRHNYYFRRGFIFWRGSVWIAHFFQEGVEDSRRIQIFFFKMHMDTKGLNAACKRSLASLWVNPASIYKHLDSLLKIFQHVFDAG